MKKIVLIIISILCITNNLLAQDVRFANANSLYQNGKFEEARNSYLEILKTGVQSPELLYNLGNSFFKTNDYASAILYYERAILLAPNDADLKANLELANAQIVDKLTPLGEFFLFRWISSIGNSLSSDAWAIWAIVSLFMLLGCLIAFFYINTALIKQIVFYGGLSLLFLNISTSYFASTQKEKLERQDMAIVFNSSVTVKSSPDLTGSELFVLHSGTKVKVLKKIGSWAEIQLIDGNIGWLQMSSIVII